MEYRHLHPWDVTIEQAAQIQRDLRSQIVLHPPEGFIPRYIAGADVSSTRRSNTVYAGFVVIDVMTMATVAQATAVSEATFPYVPGFLSFRELPALADAWAKLEMRPDVLVMDGQGLAHPRRMGIACHAGLVFDLPTIGCAKSILIGHHEPVGHERGAESPLIDKGETIGMALRTRDWVSPVFISPGHRMDLTTAVRLILMLTPEGRYRLPETTRRAHRLVNDVRIAHE